MLSGLFGVFRLYRIRLGRRVYLLLILLPFVTLTEGLGITLLLPLLDRLGATNTAKEAPTGLIQTFIASLPIPESSIWLLSLVAAIFLLKAVLGFGTQAFRAVLQARLTTGLKADLIECYTNLSFSAFSARNTGQYVNISTNQTSQVGQAFQMLTQTAMQAISSVVFLMVAAVVNWQFAVVAGVVGLVFAAVTLKLARYVAGLSRQTVAEQTGLNIQLVQVLQSMKYLVATDRTNLMVHRTKKICRRLRGHRARTGIAHGFVASIKEPLSVILILVLIGIQITVFKQPLSTIFVSLLLLDKATKAMISVQGSWQRTMELVGAVESVQDELQFVHENCERRGMTIAPEFSSAITFQNVCFAYNVEDGNVLNRVDITIPHNKTVAFVGQSGAGKSTLADLLTLLLKPTKGQIVIDGITSTDMDPRTWRQQIGYVCQETVVFDETIAANICMDEVGYATDPVIRQRVADAANRAFATEFIDCLPDGFRTVVGDRGVRLSGGQRQRLFIARELYKQPRLLLLDEATSALDAESEKAIQEGIDALHGQVTVVLIAHRLSTIRNADYIYVLAHGDIVEEGSYQELTEKPESRFREMVNLQSL